MQTPVEAIEAQDPTHLRMVKTFYPFAYERTLEAARKNIRFVHYTSAETAMKILQGKEVWLRKSSVMNDFLEIEYGLGCLNTTFNKRIDRFKQIFDGMFAGFSDKLLERFNGWLPHFRSDTYMTCFSEHDDSEDLFGRLSMWRAYGQPTGVAIVINSGPFMRPTDALRTYASPVAYLSLQQFEQQFDVLLDRIEGESQFVRERDETIVFNFIFSAFRAATLCTKHPGFHEEREWRVIHSPTFARSERIITETVIIGGVPQPICRIPLQDVPEEGLVGLEIPALVDRIIIGPTEYPSVIREAFQVALLAAGVPDAIQRIVVSDIPLRR